MINYYTAVDNVIYPHIFMPNPIKTTVDYGEYEYRISVDLDEPHEE